MISVGDELVIVDSTDATNQNKLDALTEAFEAVVAGSAMIDCCRASSEERDALVA